MVLCAATTPGPTFDAHDSAPGVPETTWVKTSGQLMNVFVDLLQRPQMSLVQGGMDSALSALYVARAQRDLNIYPGKCCFHLSTAHFAIDGCEELIYEYEVLIGQKDEFEWVPLKGRFDSSILGHRIPVVGGYTTKENGGTDTLYIARGKHDDGSVQCGHIKEGGVARFGWGLSVHEVDVYDVLVHGSLNKYAVKVAVGQYSTTIHWRHVRPGDRYSEVMHLNPPLEIVPKVITTLSKIDFGDSDRTARSLLIRAHPQNTTRTDFICNAETWTSTAMLYNASVNWAAIEEPSWQSGVFKSTDVHDGMQSVFHHRVPFERRFTEGPPMLFVGFSHLDVGETWALRTYATNVDHTGFNISVVKAHDESETAPALRAASVSWIAVPGPEALKNRSAWVGSFGSGDSAPSELSWSGHVEFGVTFRRAPKVMVGINHFDVSSAKNFRLKVTTSNVTRNGMDWRINGWGDTVVRGATVSYLAVDSVY